MSKRNSDTVISSALRDLDPAPAAPLSAAERERADAAFARIVAAPGRDQVSAEPEAPRRRRSRLLVPVALAGAAGAAVPALVLSGGSAFGSWTPTPEPLAGPAAAEVAATCRTVLAKPDQGERVVIAERRGEWTYVLLAGPRAEASCLLPRDAVGQGSAAELEARGSFGTYGAGPVEAPTVAPDGIHATSSMAGSVPSQSVWPFAPDEWFTWVEGYVGSDVTGVTVHPPVGPDVEATVSDGRFAAWWPGDEAEGENPAASKAWSYTLTLADGSTRRATG